MIFCEHAASLLQLRPCLILDSFGPHLYTRPLPSSLLRLISLYFRDWQFATAEVLVQALSGPAVKVPPPVLQVDGFINQEYFGVLAGEKGPYITNVPPEFPQNHTGARDTQKTGTPLSSSCFA